MTSLSEEEDQFFEACEEVTSVSYSSYDCPENLDYDDRNVMDFLLGSFSYEVCIKNLGSIHER